MAAIADEIEAKLLAPDLERLDAVAVLERLGTCRLRPRRRARLHSVYLDTAALTLARAGIALRVRKDGARWEATAKWMGRVRGHVHERPELNVRLAAAPGKRFVLPAGPLRDRLCALVAGRPLVPILITEIERRLIDVLPPAAGRGTRAPFAELALDRVRTCAPRRNARGRARALAEYGELEIELRAGPARALEPLARELQRELGFTPAAGNKFTRGLALVYGSAGLWSGPPRLPGSHDTLADAARKALALPLASIREHDPDTRLGADPHAVHQMRVAVRRARAAVRAFAGGIPVRTAARLALELRWLGRVLGGVRDLDVQLAAQAKTARSAGPGQRRALTVLSRRLTAERVHRRAALVAALESRRYFALLVTLEAFTLSSTRRSHAAARAPLPDLAQTQIERALRAVRRRGRKLAQRAEAPDPEALHALRIRAKRLRYLLEFLSDLTGNPGRRLVERVTRLQDVLGKHQDAMVAVQSMTFERARLARAGSANTRPLEGLIRRQEQRGARARAGFAAAWHDFASGSTKRDLRKLRRRLRAASRATLVQRTPGAI